MLSNNSITFNLSKRSIFLASEYPINSYPTPNDAVQHVVSSCMQNILYIFNHHIKSYIVHAPSSRTPTPGETPSLPFFRTEIKIPNTSPPSSSTPRHYSTWVSHPSRNSIPSLRSRPQTPFPHRNQSHTPPWSHTYPPPNHAYQKAPDTP